MTGIQKEVQSSVFLLTFFFFFARRKLTPVGDKMTMELHVTATNTMLSQKKDDLSIKFRDKERRRLSSLLCQPVSADGFTSTFTTTPSSAPGNMKVVGCDLSLREVCALPGKSYIKQLDRVYSAETETFSKNTLLQNTTKLSQELRRNPHSSTAPIRLQH